MAGASPGNFCRFQGEIIGRRGAQKDIQALRAEEIFACSIILDNTPVSPSSFDREGATLNLTWREKFAGVDAFDAVRIERCTS